MKHFGIKVITALLGLLLAASCSKTTADEETLVGNWWYEEAVNVPVEMIINADGDAFYYVGPGCFGDPQRTSLKWWLTDYGKKVYFAVAELQSDPSIKWRLRKVTEDELVVDECMRREDGKWTETIPRTYHRRLIPLHR